MPSETQPESGELYRNRQQQLQDNQYHQVARLVSTYTTANGSYETNQVNQDEDYNLVLNHEIRRPSSGASSLAHFISHAFARGAKTNYLFAYILIVNLLMAILNTTLLSFVVRSVQLNELTHLGAGGSGKSLAWDEHLEGVALELPTILAGQKSLLSVRSIGSHENKPLRVHSFSSVNKQKQNSNDGDDDGQILIRAGGEDDQIEEQTRNHIIIDSKYFDYNERQTQTELAKGDKKHPRRPVEIVTNNLILNKIVAENTHSIKTNDKFTATKPIAIKRLLEFSSEQQSIVLPLVDRLELYPLHASGLLVGKEFRLRGTEIRGSTSDDFDIQTQRGNLTCDSPSGSLRVVTKSAKLNVISTDSLELNAPELKLNAPKIYLTDGIEFFDTKPIAAKENSSDHSPKSKRKLTAYKLVLIDGKLMAARD